MISKTSNALLLLFLATLSVGCSKNDGGNGAPNGDTSEMTSSDATSSTDGSTTQIDPVGDRGPGRVLDVPAARQTQDLNLRISTENSGDVVARGQGYQTEVFELDFEFESQDLWGETWRHKSSLFIPHELSDAGKNGAFVIVPAGTKNPVDKVSQPNVFRNNYAGIVAATMGIPAMVVANVPGAVDLKQAPDNWQGKGPAKCFASGLPSSRYTPCLLEILRQTNDAQADPFRHIAFAWMRSVTAVFEAAREANQKQWPDMAPAKFQPKNGLILADGELAVGARMAAAVDIRIDGVFGNADFAKMARLLDRMNKRWNRDFGWFEKPGKFRQWLGSSAGKAWKKTVDPAAWPQLLEGMSFVNARGTNDPRFPLDAAALIGDVFPNETRRVTAPSYAAGIGSLDHLQGWYGFIAHVHFQKPWSRLSIDATQMQSNVHVEASAAGGATVNGVVVNWLQQHRDTDDGDFRDTVWQGQMLTETRAGWAGDVAPIVTNHAVYVRAENSVEVPTVLDEPKTWEIKPRWSSGFVLFGD